MVSVGAKGARRTLIAIRTVRDLADQSSRAAGNPKFGVGDSFPPSAGQGPSSQQNRTPQTIRFRANALNSRGIVGAGNPERLAPTSWWWTQSRQTGLHGVYSLLTGKRTGKSSVLGRSFENHPYICSSFHDVASKFPKNRSRELIRENRE
jgi:hypothetical protein